MEVDQIYESIKYIKKVLKMRNYYDIILTMCKFRSCFCRISRWVASHLILRALLSCGGLIGIETSSPPSLSFFLITTCILVFFRNY
jgi:hypothetical protein